MSWIESLRSTDWNHAFGVFSVAYVLGCFTAGYYLVRWMAGQDIREIGSHSVGARNVSRVLGKPGFVFTALFDFGKGALMVGVTHYFTTDDRLVLLAMAGVVAGHVWPVQLRFHGGKGMATSLGSLLMYAPPLAMVFLVLFLCLFVVMRRTVLPGLFALACVPFASLWFEHAPARVILLSLWAGIVLLAHRKNVTEEFFQLVARRHPQTEPNQSHL